MPGVQTVLLGLSFYNDCVHGGLLNETRMSGLSHDAFANQNGRLIIQIGAQPFTIRTQAVGAKLEGKLMDSVDHLGLGHAAKGLAVKGGMVAHVRESRDGWSECQAGIAEALAISARASLSVISGPRWNEKVTGLFADLNIGTFAPHPARYSIRH